jgi:WhiB family transcriptional regulator, redox-sensing transcriptional regulator
VFDPGMLTRLLLLGVIAVSDSAVKKSSTLVVKTRPLAVAPTCEAHGSVSTIGSVLRPPVWYRRAACRGVSPELFLAVRGSKAERAKAVCAGCEVAEECLDFALRRHAPNEDVGIWGGTTPAERRRLRVERGIVVERREHDICRHGHALTTDASGRRICRACRKANSARLRALRRAERQQTVEAAARPQELENERVRVGNVG